MDENINNYVIKRSLSERIQKNKNCLILVVGETGSGKSYFSIEMARQLDPTFTIDRCVWDSLKFNQLLAAKLPPGSAIVADELGIFMGARDWQKKENKLLSKALQTIRFMNHYIFFTVPQLSMVDVHARKLFHFIAVAKGKIKGNVNRVAFHRLTENTRRPQNLPFRNPFLYKQKGELKQTATFCAPLPPQHFIDEYEARRADKIQKMLEENVSDLGETKEAEIKYCSNCKIINESATCKRCGRDLI